MIKRLLSLAVLLLSFSAKAQVDIATARTQANGSTVTVNGIVLNGAELNGSGNAIRYIQDATGGLALFTTGNALNAVQRGDNVEATGTVSPYNNLFEIAVT